jgi:hypothetical protein
MEKKQGKIDLVAPVLSTNSLLTRMSGYQGLWYSIRNFLHFLEDALGR